MEPPGRVGHTDAEGTALDGAAALLLDKASHCEQALGNVLVKEYFWFCCLCLRIT